MSGGCLFLHVDLHNWDIKPKSSMATGVNILKANPNNASAAFIRGWIQRCMRQHRGPLHSMTICVRWPDFTSVGPDLLKGASSLLNTIHRVRPSIPIDILVIEAKSAKLEDFLGALPSLPPNIAHLVVGYCKIPEEGIPSDVWGHLKGTEKFDVFETAAKSIKLVRPCENK